MNDDKTSKAIPLAALQVLLVDDDSFMLELVRDMLLDLGVKQIATALDGKRGIAAFESGKKRPDLVICDLNMPDKDGFQFMEMLADRRYVGNVVLMSGMGERVINSAQLMARFHRLNILGSLAKPISRDAGIFACESRRRLILFGAGGNGAMTAFADRSAP
ncbi:Response regulator receiver domain-containing protein [Noviherbaspirillum humi]|uniref:Response regulator receiver domain-containing protein n=2 Tax=Noviherbaspirillum humi TaxID=1688639 RepID=A0A239JXN3_9BURK|nr:Response regulator receiver domain-containing protein [Noviherbaspirillum humi]